MKKVISTTKAPKAIGPYSQAIEINGFVYLSGQVPFDPETGEMINGPIEDQVRRVMENIRGVLLAAGLDFSAVVKTTIFLTDLGDFAKVNEIYGSYFTSDPPARSTVQVAALPRGASVEIEVIAAEVGDRN